MGYIADMSEEELLRELSSEPHGEFQALHKTTVAVEFLRRKVGDLARSSKRLENATYVLIALTFILGVLTAVLAWPALRSALSMLRR